MTLLQTLIASAQADEAKRAAAIEAAQAAAQTRGLATLRSLLPDDIWTALNVDWDRTTYNSDGSAVATGVVEVRGEPVQWQAVCKYGERLRIACQYLNLYFETDRDEDSTATVSRFLLNVSRSILAQRELKRSERPDAIKRQFSFKIVNSDNPDDYLALRDEAIDLAPDRFNEFMALYEEWRARYQQHLAEQAAQAQQDAEHKAATEAFVERKAEWYRRAKAIVEHNEAVTANYQTLADVPADLWLLTYALLGDDGEGGRAVETREVYCYPAEEDNPAFWSVINGPGPEFAAQETYFMHPVGFRKVSVKPSDKMWPTFYTIHHCGQHLVIGPATPDGLVNLWKAELRTVDTNSMPAYPEHFGDHYGLNDMADQRAMALAATKTPATRASKETSP